MSQPRSVSDIQFTPSSVWKTLHKLPHGPLRTDSEYKFRKSKASQVYVVGFNSEQELRKSLVPHQGGTKAAHWRRGHWHRYWIGPRDGERKLEPRWVKPMLVAGVEAEAKPYFVTD
jgi:hypothetical protein